MLIKLLLIFTIVPLLELWLLIEVGRMIGTWPTVILVAATGFYGVLLARSQGLQVIFKMRQVVQQGGMPANEILDGACILVGGALLLTPGLLTDLFGFSLLLPPTRNYIKKVTRQIISKKIEAGVIHIHRRW